MIRKHLFTAACVVVFMGCAVAGWAANNGYRYMVEVFRKAAQCDQLNCEQMKTEGQKIINSELPVRKDLNHDAKNPVQ